MKGLSVDVYKTGRSDCTNGGISSKTDSLILVGKLIPEIFEGDETNLISIKVKIISGKKYFYATPIKIENGISMFGGNFIYSSDSRFPFDHPISLHDRVEA